MPDVDASVVVPKNGSAIRRPASLHRVAVDRRSPCFTGKFHFPFGTTRTLRLPAMPPAALRFLRLAVPRVRRRFAPARQPTRCRRAGVLLCAATQNTADSPWKWLDLPSSRRTLCRRAHAPSTPEQPTGTRLFAPTGPATDQGTTVACSTELSRLNRMARRLAVYASPGRSPDPTQDSLAAAG